MEVLHFVSLCLSGSCRRFVTLWVCLCKRCDFFSRVVREAYSARYLNNFLVCCLFFYSVLILLVTDLIKTIGAVTDFCATSIINLINQISCDFILDVAVVFDRFRSQCNRLSETISPPYFIGCCKPFKR